MNIVEKIQKLLALSESSNPNEAALAAQRAQELMVKYAIDEAALRPEERKVEPILTEAILTEYQRLPSWHPLLAYVLAPSFFCRSFFGRGNAWVKARIYIVGTTSDRAAWRATYDYLKHEIEHLAEVEWKKVSADHYAHGKRWKTAFFDGCCRTIEARLTENLTKHSQESESTAIVLVNKQKEVDDFMAANHTLKKNTNSRSVDSSGYWAGRKAGENLNLGPRAKQLTA